MLLTSRSYRAITVVGLFWLQLCGQIRFDTYPKIPEFSALTNTHQQSVSELRLFLWQHWNDRQRAIAQLKTVSRENSHSLITYTIAPDHRQRWAITEVLQGSEIVWVGTRDVPPSVRVAFSLEVVEEKPDGSVQLVPNPKAPFADSYKLRLKSTEGKEFNL